MKFLFLHIKYYGFFKKTIDYLLYYQNFIRLVNLVKKFHELTNLFCVFFAKSVIHELEIFKNKRSFEK